MLTITVDDQELRSLFTRLLGRADDMAPVMEKIGDMLEGRVRGRFEAERDPMGEPWKPWAASTRKSYPHPGSTAAKKAGRPGNARILDRFGDMLNGLSWQADAASVRVGFARPYAVYHEFGARNMPRRGLLFENPDAGTLAPDDRDAVIDIITEYLQSPLDGA